MIVKGFLANDYSKIGNEVEITLDQKYVEEIRNNFLKELLEATINYTVDPEYLELFEDVDDWEEYKNDLLSNPDELFKAFAEEDIHSAINQKAEEVYEDNKSRYFPVNVHISGSATIYVKARTENDVQDVLYNLDAETIMDDYGSIDYEIEDYSIESSAVSEDYIKYEVVYDAEDYL